MRGRKPTPNRIKQLRGNPGKRPLSQEADFPPGLPPAPKFLKGDALAEWKRVAPLLDKAKLVCESDVAALAGYCLAWAATVKASKPGATKGELLRCLAAMRPYLAMFGFAPSERMRVHPLAPADGERDDFNDFLKGAATPN